MECGNLVSVIVPVYNVEKYLRRCIDSLINQTYKNLEIILVNDGSTDSSADICNALSSEDKRIKVIHKANGGLSSARNAGLDIAKGKYISFIDSDDYITLTMIENMVALMCDDKAQIAITGRVNRYEDSDKEIEAFKKNEVKRYSSDEVLRELLLRDKIDVSVCDKIFERTLFDDIRFPVGENNEDCAVIFKIVEKIKFAVHTDSCDYYYCHRGNSITTTMSVKTITNMVHHAEDILRFIMENKPSLIKEARYFLGFAYITGYRDIVIKLKCFGEKASCIESLYFHLKKEMKKNYGIGKDKSFFSAAQKKFFNLNAMGLYDFLAVAKHNFKKR